MSFNADIAHTFRAIDQIDAIVKEVSADLELDKLEALGARLAHACDVYSKGWGHHPDWTKKKAQSGIISILAASIERGMGGYFG